MKTPAFEHFLPGFEHTEIEGAGARIGVSFAGEGFPLLLLHGHPQTRLTWHRMAPKLLQAGYHLVLADLRGYGDSGKPVSAPDHSPYSKRAMAADQVAVMRALGHERFGVIGHDRGARVAHRMALDFPDAVASLTLIDIAPTATMYARTDMAFAMRYFWWFFLPQPAPLPEKMIGANPAFFLEKHIRGQMRRHEAYDPALMAEYLRCYARPETIHAICEDYRAAATIDLQHDAESDAEGRKVIAPLQAIWGARGTVGQLYDVLETWREKALTIEGRALDCGHTLQEELPGETASEIIAFLRRTEQAMVQATYSRSISTA
ncbi:MAG: alpha/beta hydrolase [Rhizobiales bacterium]|nr:alpha/beta hydrolase [Hyphomicrobiales bacterium]